MPIIEKAVGQRLREFRELRLISRTAFATKLHVSRAQLMNYEDGLAPLPWKVGLQLTYTFGVNPRWLVTGKLPMTIRRISRWPEPVNVRPRDTFTKIYKELLQSVVETDTLYGVSLSFDPKIKTDQAFSGFLDFAATGWAQRLPKHKHREFFLELTAEAERIIQQLHPEDKGPCLD